MSQLGSGEDAGVCWGCGSVLGPNSDICRNCGALTGQATRPVGPRRKSPLVVVGAGAAVVLAAGVAFWVMMGSGGRAEPEAAQESGIAASGQAASEQAVETPAAKATRSKSAKPAPAATKTVFVTPEEADLQPDPDWILYPVSAQESVSVRKGPGSDYRKIGELRRGTKVHIVCMRTGEPVVDRLGHTITNWDRIDYPLKGYVTDAFINTGGSPANVPRC